MTDDSIYLEIGYEPKKPTSSAGGTSNRRKECPLRTQQQTP